MTWFLRKLRVIFWFSQEFIKRHSSFFLIGFSTGLLLFFFLLRIYPLLEAASSINKKRIGMVGVYTPTTIPPAIQNLISVGLTKIGPDGEAKPALASSWEVRDEGKVYIFYLRDNIFWHDGRKFKASDVNYNLKDVKIETQDPFTLKITLAEPFAALPVLLSRPLFKKGLIGLGPYKIASLKLNAERIEVMELVPFLKSGQTLKIRFYPTEKSLLIAFKLGEINAIDELLNIGQFASWKKLKVEEKILANRYLVIFLNNNDEHLKERGIRQALAFAIPEFKEATAISSISPNSWAYNRNVKVYKQDLKGAKKLLEKASLKNGFEITLSTFPNFLNVAQDIANNWSQIGIKTNIQVVSDVPSDFQALLTAQEVPPDPDQYLLWHSTQGQTNLTHYANPKVDKLLEDGRRTLDKEKRAKIYEDFQKYLVEDCPAIFLYHPKIYSISRG